MTILRPILRATPLALAAAAAAQSPGLPTFSIDWRSATVSTPDSFTATPITEGDLLMPQGLVPAFGPLPPPGIVESGGSIAPVGLGLPLHFPCVGHPAGTPCAVEVDALSHAMDRMINCSSLPGTPNPTWVFSVSYRGLGVPGFPPDLASESACVDETADVFAGIFVPCGPVGPGPTIGNYGYIDGNGLVNACGTSVYPGLGLIEPTFPGDNLDALDDDVPDQWLPRSTCTYFSLDSGFLDPVFLVPNSGSAVANGFVGGDVLVSCPSCAPAVYASALQLGLDFGGPDTDDLDALALRENGIPGYQRSTTPYDWVTGASDMLFFSVRRGSALIGTPDAFFGAPIEPGDVLVPTGGIGSPPGIWVSAETLGLMTMRSTAGVISDDMDALDILQEPEPGTRFCFGDGSGTACPCGNFGFPGRGCANSVNPVGGLLWANGFASISNDSVHFTVSGLPGSVTALLYQGTGVVNAGNGAVFGDGLRCVQQNVIRLYKQPTLCGNREFGKNVPGDLPVAVAGGVTTPGVRNYQVWYRNAATFCTPSTWNLTNGYRIAWAP
ncbi:MAG: hypothetical protein NTY35_01480 [Planctomycetota bacterium]|nr:hypothetical protein [Planctomycetota bacterium]